MKKNPPIKLMLLLALSLSSNAFAATSASPDTGSASDYAPKGIRVGSFEIKPVLKLGSDWNSNIYNSQKNTVDAFVTHVAPSVNVTSNWNRHFVGLSVKSDIQNYINHPHENREIIDVILNGRLDVVRDSFAYANLSYLNSPEQRGAPDSPVNALKPTGSQTSTAEVGYDHAIHRIRLHIDNSVSKLEFANGTTQLGTAILNDQNRSRLVNISTARIGYEITPNYEAFIKGGYNFINYDSKFNQQGYQRSSDGYKVVAGVAMELTGKLTGDARVGYQGQSYDDPRLNKISGVSGGLTLKWTPSGLTTVTADVTRAINETTQLGSSGFFSTMVSTTVEHELLRNLLISGVAGYTYNDYIGSGAAFAPRTEDNYMAGIKAKYLLNRYFFGNVGYLYNGRTVQHIQNNNYDTSLFYIGIGSQF